MWIEATVAPCLDGLRKTTKFSVKVVSVAVSMGTGFLQNTSQKRCHLGELEI
jgi:hypothetical protein